MFVALLLTLPAVAAPIVPTSISASSSYPAENGVSYSAKNLLDGRGDTAWIEGDRGSGLGASATWGVAVCGAGAKKPNPAVSAAFLRN